MDDALARTGGAACTTARTRLHTQRRLRPHAHRLRPPGAKWQGQAAQYTGSVYNRLALRAPPKPGRSRLIP